MKRQKSCGPHWGKLVHQLPGVVTFAYDLHFRRTIAHWKGIVMFILIFSVFREEHDGDVFLC
jgi:hypothetical protein